MGMDRKRPDPPLRGPFAIPIMTGGKVPKDREQIKEMIFATKIAHGLSPTEAVKVAFADDIDAEDLNAKQIYQKAYGLKKRKKIRTLIAWYEDEVRAYCNVHPAQWVREMREHIVSATRAGNWAAVMRGMELIGKQGGLFSETLILKRDRDELTEEQCVEQIRALVDSNPDLKKLITGGQGDVVEGEYKVLSAETASDDAIGTETDAPPQAVGEEINQKASPAAALDHPA